MKAPIYGEDFPMQLIEWSISHYKQNEDSV